MLDTFCFNLMTTKEYTLPLLLSIIYSLNRYLFVNHYTASTLLGTRDTVWKKTEKKFKNKERRKIIYVRN